MLVGFVEMMYMYLELSSNSQLLTLLHVWQSQIEFEYHSVTYFEHITKFDAL